MSNNSMFPAAITMVAVMPWLPQHLCLDLKCRH